ncbi:MAG: hypothetical protein R3B13_04065 [Polyangiaceae bacterium]
MKSIFRTGSVFGFFALSACATLASEAGDDDAFRPNSLAGPFRYLVRPELASTPPYTLRRKNVDHSDATVIALDGDRVALYASAEIAGVAGIYRFVAEDGRSFAEQPEPTSPVLVPSQSWEGSAVGAPSVLRVGSEVWMAYAADGGIGIARSSDGMNFDSPAQPSLSSDAAPNWEAGDTVHAPALFAAGDGEIRMLYAAGGSLGEARAGSGTTFERMPEPVLGPGSGDAFDAAGVDDPEVWLAVSAEGRRVTRVYYTGATAAGARAIGFAGRFGASGPLTRNPVPALSGPRFPRAPAVLPRSGHTLLFVTQFAGSGSGEQFPALAVAVAPAIVQLPAATPL